MEDKFDIIERLEKENQSIEEKAEYMAKIEASVLAFMQANNIKELEIEGMRFSIEEGD